MKKEIFNQVAIFIMVVFCLLIADLRSAYAQNGEILFATDFTSETNLNGWDLSINPEWNLQTPSFAGANGQAIRGVNTTTTGSRKILRNTYNNGDAWGHYDYNIECIAGYSVLANSARLGLLSRGSDNNNHYFGYYIKTASGGTFELVKRKGGTNTTLATKNVAYIMASGQYRKIRLETFDFIEDAVTKTKLNFYFDIDNDGIAELVLEAVDSNNRILTGKPGLYTFGQSTVFFDNIEITKYKKPAENSVVSPISGSFTRNPVSVNYKDIEISAELKGNTLVSITNSGNTLTVGTDYTIGTEISGVLPVILKKEYLASLGAGTYTFTFNFNAGEAKTFTLEIIDNDPVVIADAKINPVFGIFDKNHSMPEYNDILVNIELNGNNLTEIKVNNTSLTEGVDFLKGTESSGLLPVSIKKEFLETLPVGKHEIEFVFTPGATQVFYLDIEHDQNVYDWAGILKFKVAGQVDFAIDPVLKSVRFVMPYNTDKSQLTPAILVSAGAVISPLSGVIQNFTSPVEYTVTLPDGEIQKWWVFCGIDLTPPNMIENMTLVGSNVTKQLVSVEGMPFQVAQRVINTVKPANLYGIELQSPLNNFGAINNSIYATAYMRTISTTNESSNGQANFIVQENVSNYRKSLNAPIATPADEEWTRFDFLFPAQYRVGCMLTFHLGYNPQTVEFGGIQIVDYGVLSTEQKKLFPVTKFTYSGREPEAQWRADALARIEQIRKSDIKINVTDQNGQPVEGAEVSVKMTRNAFKFGTAVTETWINTNPGADAPRYRDSIQSVGFNTIYPANAYKWFPWENQWNPEVTTAWARNAGMDVAAHALIWQRGDNNISPLDVFAAPINTNNNLLKRRIDGHIRQIMSHNAGGVISWDVLNEVINNNSLTNKLGKEETANWFKLAKSLDPRAEIVMNEAAINPGSLSTVTNYLNNYVIPFKNYGAPIEALGYQGHFAVKPASPESVYELLNRLAAHCDKVYITEYDVETLDDELYGDHLRDIMIAIYSHPKGAGFTMWGFWDGQHWRGKAPLFWSDWTPKKGYYEYVKLVKNEWNTNVKGVTNEAGVFETRGHHGDYLITIKKDNQEFQYTRSLSKDGLEMTINLGAIPGSDASLSKLEFQGKPIEGFSPDKLNYTIELPTGKVVIPAALYAEANDSQATVKTTFKRYMRFELPPQHIIEVTAHDGITRRNYVIDFTYRELASLQSARGKKLDVASVTANGTLTGSNPANAIDGDLSTSWQPVADASQNNNTHIKFDFGRIMDLSGIAITWQSATNEKIPFWIEVSSDNTNWWRVGALWSNGTSEPELYDFAKINFGFSDVFGRWLRIAKGQSSWNGPLKPISEVAIYGDELGELYKTPPFISCGAGGTQNVDANIGATYVHAGYDWDATATELITFPAKITYELSGSTTGTGSSLNGVAFNKGTTTVTWTATNGAGSSSTCSFDVIVKKHTRTNVTVDKTMQQFSDEVILKATIEPFVAEGFEKAAESVTFYIGSQAMGTAAIQAGEALLAVALNEFVAGALLPGEKVVRAVFNAKNDDYIIEDSQTLLTVTCEDADVVFIGQQLVATVNSKANVDLRWSVRDAEDGSSGDISKAIATIKDLESNQIVFGPVPVADLVDANTGIISKMINVTLSNNEDARIINYGLYIDGYYCGESEVVVVVYKPTGDFITGGGYIIPTNAFGVYGVGSGNKANFGFNVKFNKKGTNIQGKMNYLFRSNDKLYQFKTNATISLGVNVKDNGAKTAIFTSKANLSEILENGTIVPVRSNLLMKLEITDKGEPGSNDEFAITVWNGNQLIYSNNWNGSSSQKQTINGGNLKVQSGFSTDFVDVSTETIKSGVIGPDLVNDVVKVYPNPFSDRLSFDLFPKENSKARIDLFDATGRLAETIFEGEVNGQQEYRFYYKPQKIISTSLTYRIVIGNEVITGKVVSLQ